MELSEVYKQSLCKCESCGYYPLRHLETCPKCGSEAFHEAIRGEKKQKENEERRR